MALGAGACGQHDERLRAVLGVQELAVDVDPAEFGIDESLLIVIVLGDLLPLPETDELGAECAGAR